MVVVLKKNYKNLQTKLYMGEIHYKDMPKSRIGHGNDGMSATQNLNVRSYVHPMITNFIML